MKKYQILYLIIAILFGYSISDSTHLICRDPDLGGQLPVDSKDSRKYLIIGGHGGGIGNFLVFFPAAYHFAAISGRDILIEDGSIIGELCVVLQCGFPLYSEVRAIAPHWPTLEQMNLVRGIKAYDFNMHLNGEANFNDELLRAEGFRISSGWYFGRNFSEECVARITGCHREDCDCHDRHALKRLIRGPFYPIAAAGLEERLVGGPTDMLKGMVRLPHAYAPRIDAAIHIRTQFSHFEWLVGPEDAAWADAVKERDTWLNSTANSAGVGLFKIIEEKVMSDLAVLKQSSFQRHQAAGGITGRRNLGAKADSHSSRRRMQETGAGAGAGAGVGAGAAAESYDQAFDNKIRVFISSDNEVVKEALANYFIDHDHIEVVRVRNNGIIVHAKNVAYLKSNGNNTGVADLVMDWYALSLANIVYAYRRDTEILSSFAQSARRVSGSHELSNYSAPIGRGIGTFGEQLHFKRGHPVWNKF